MKKINYFKILADKTINFEHANKVLEDERKKASEYLDKALND